MTFAGRRPEFWERTFFAALRAFSITNRLMLKPAAVAACSMRCFSSSLTQKVICLLSPFLGRREP